ncbi:hydrolase 1, exosortase A system-associated [Pseudothauera rhizosphaerae]|uniref:Hydrolase 1, exosortase A system-associated n=1 Tax=Pseudothauera rhizosphaerae TaxID=2565932 RepID=A0A4S4APJ2_9RHOO|nr:hydrolase 1, exosortase A system-associated [Pseudothauera rhizosphaerae]THF61613.1 hydrolase 1, exosortase A system-associated [Pseudothauera rhizosphaerae]
MSETPLVFPCAGELLVGVLHRPVQPASVGVVVVVGGPQYRAGSHRQFTLLGRELARAGFPCLRFDYRGMGDSAAPRRDFQAVDEDIRAAIDALLGQCPELGGVVLWGLCDGASAALMYAPADSRVGGIVAVNPWVRSEATLAQARVSHYYARRLFDPALWRKLVSGDFAWRSSLADAATSVWRVLRARSSKRSPAGKRPAGFQQRMAIGWQHLQGKVLFVLSGNDLTAAEFLHHARSTPSWQPFPEEGGGALHVVAEADHTFSRPEWNARLTDLTLQWLGTVAASRPHPSPLREPCAQPDAA